MTKVVLERQPAKPNKEFPAETFARAQQRALALCGLHGCNFTVSADETTIYVHAEDWYNR